MVSREGQMQMCNEDNVVRRGMYDTLRGLN